jgi:Enoyl-CoA hydratase/isomerase
MHDRRAADACRSRSGTAVTLLFVTSPAVLGIREAAARLRRAGQQGSDDRPGALAGEPLLVVDLDSEGDPGSLELPESLPYVVVGIGRDPVGGDALHVDVALTDSSSAPAPWVEVAGLDAGLSDLATGVVRSPMAAVTLVQVLRGGGRSRLGHELLLESLAYSSLQAGPEFGAWLAGRGLKAAPEGPSPDDVVLVERAGDRLDVTLNRPAVRNAYSAAMRDQLCAALAVAASDPSVTEVHLFGTGPDFCSGGDLDEFGTLPDPVTAHFVRIARSAAGLLAAVGDRVVAHLHGACVGAGIELPAFACRVAAAPDTRVRLPELAMGLIPGAGGTASLPRRIGRHRTAWMALTGGFVDAGVAQRWGLVDELDAG